MLILCFPHKFGFECGMYSFMFIFLRQTELCIFWVMHLSIFQSLNSLSIDLGNATNDNQVVEPKRNKRLLISVDTLF